MNDRAGHRQEFRFAVADSRVVNVQAANTTSYRQSFYTVIACCSLIVYTTFLYLPDLYPLPLVLQLLRYLLWPSIMFCVLWSISYRGVGQLWTVLRPFVPFFLIGVATIGVSPDIAISIREIVFWLFGVLAAAVCALEISAGRGRKLLFWIFFGIVGSSFLAVMFLPDIATSRDLREQATAWNGLFTNKNQFGYIASYLFVIALVVPGLNKAVRLCGLALALLCTMFSYSIGSYVVTILVSAYVLTVWAIRKLNFDALASSALLVMLIGTFTVALALWYQPLLELLGRDATLTGRTEIWPAFLNRAAQEWLTGTGPGTFSLGSEVTADLSRRFLQYGQIDTPHNMFIAAFGETGLFGLVAFATPLLLFSLGSPFRYRSSFGLITGTFAFAMIANGLMETREVFGYGLGIFMLVFALGSLRHSAELGFAPTEKSRGGLRGHGEDRVRRTSLTPLG